MNKIVSFLIRTVITVIIVYIALRFMNGYRLFNHYTFPEGEVSSIGVFSVDGSKEDSYLINYTVEEKEFIEKFVTSIKLGDFKDKFFRQGSTYPRYNMVVNFKDTNKKSVIMSFSSDGNLKIFGESYKILYEDNIGEEWFIKFRNRIEIIE